MLTWSACIATLNRHEVLKVALTHLLRQTRPPKEIVVVDASENWEEGRAMAEQLLASQTEIALIYGTSPQRSSATQRNLAVSRATGDIVFLVDDDSFLHDSCAAELMRVYEADTSQEVAGVGAFLTDDNPAAQPGGAGSGLGRKDTGRASLENLARRVLATRVGRWINREILYQNAEMLFMRYEEPRVRHVPPALAHLDVTPTSFMPGSGMSFRRTMGEKEQFDTALRYYAAFEDLDIGYRIARHGQILQARAAKLHHFEAASGRIKRKKAITFQLLNMAVFLKRHADRPGRFLSRYRMMLRRRLLSEFLKDILSRRWRFPQVAGVITAMRHWRDIWRRDPSEIDSWYPELQRRIIEEIT